MSTDTVRRLLKEKMRMIRAELILDIAEELLVQKGYHEASMDEIASRAGVAKGTLYQHFPRKEDLVCALVERYLDLFEHIIARAMLSGSTARGKLEYVLFSAYQEQGSSHTQFLRLLLHDLDIRKSLMEKMEPLHDRWEHCQQQLRHILEEGQAEGLFVPTISSELMLSMFLSLLLFRENSPQTQIPSEELTRQVGQLFFSGIAL